MLVKVLNAVLVLFLVSETVLADSLTYKALINYKPAIQETESVLPEQLQTSIEATAKRIADLEPLCIDPKANRWQRGLAGDAIGVEEQNLESLCQRAVITEGSIYYKAAVIELTPDLFFDSSVGKIQSRSALKSQEAVRQAAKAREANERARVGNEHYKPKPTGKAVSGKGTTSMNSNTPALPAGTMLLIVLGAIWLIRRWCRN